MPSQNLLSTALTPQLLTDLTAAINTVRTLQAAFLAPLTAEQRERILRLGLGNVGIADKLRLAASENPGELSANFPMAEWDGDRAFIPPYSIQVAAIEKLARDMRDTLTRAESDNWNHALDAYADLKHDAQGPAIDDARAFFRARHGGAGQTPTVTPPPTPTPTPSP